MVKSRTLGKDKEKAEKPEQLVYGRRSRKTQQNPPSLAITIHEGHKTQEEEIDREIEEALQAETESEEDPIHEPKRLKGKGKKDAREGERNRKKVPSRSQLLNHLKSGIHWAPTRFPCPLFLRETGLYDGVYQILEHMGYQSLLTMEAQPLYEEASCHFLSSVEFYYYTDGDEEYGHGRIEFKVKGRLYKLSFKEIATIMNFKDDKYCRLPYGHHIPAKVWPLITGNTVHEPRTNKNTHIRNPVIRYIHRTLANTLFARRESGNVLDDELTLIGKGLVSLFGNEAIYPDEDDLFMEFGKVGFFIKRLEYYKGWAWTTTDTTPQLSIGGLITPLLKAVGVPLDNEPKGPQGPIYMDGPYMKKTKFISGMFQGSHVYSFILDTVLTELILPCPRVSMVRNKGSIGFNLPRDAQLGPHGPLDPVPDRRKKAGRRSASGPSSSTTAPPTASFAASSSQAAPEIHESPTLYGPPRYYFQPHTAALPRGPLRDAHEYIGKLEGWNRIQDRTIFKLKTKYKALKKTLKKVTEVLVRGGVGGCSAKDFEEPQPRRRSYHGGESSSMNSPPRLSEHQQRRKRRNPEPIRGESDNESPSMDTSEEEEEEEDEEGYEQEEGEGDDSNEATASDS